MPQDTSQFFVPLIVRFRTVVHVEVDILFSTLIVFPIYLWRGNLGCAAYSKRSTSQLSGVWIQMCLSKKVLSVTETNRTGTKITSGQNELQELPATTKT